MAVWKEGKRYQAQSYMFNEENINYKEEKYIYNNITKKGLVLKIYKELLQIQWDRTKQNDRKW